MKKTISHLFLTAILILPIFANASTFTGIPLVVRIGPGTGTSSTRVSIKVQLHGSICTWNEWFAYENATNNTESLWTKGMLDWVGGKRSVTIVGTNQCDPSGVEKINYIDFNQ